MTFKGLLILALLFFLVQESSASLRRDMYQYKNFGGTRITPLDAPNLGNYYRNNWVSSIRIVDNYEAPFSPDIYHEFYDDTNYEGPNVGFGKGEYADLGTWDNRISSVRGWPMDELLRMHRLVTVFASNNYSGYGKRFGGEVEYLQNALHPFLPNGRWNNQINSLVVGAGILAECFQQGGFQGVSVALGTGSYPNLGNYGSFFSSIKFTDVEDIEVENNQIMVFSGSQYTRFAKRFSATSPGLDSLQNVNKPWGGGNWNNDINSLIIGNGILVEMCTEPNYGGECAQFGTIKRSNLNDFNNQYSSIKMTPFNDLEAQSGQVTVFMDRGYQSYAKTFDSSAPTLASVRHDLVNTSSWNKRIVSFIVGPDVLVEMCTEPNYGGECEQFGKLKQYTLHRFEYMFSSLKVTQFDDLGNAAGQVAVFTGTNFEDYAITFDSSAPRLAGVGNDFVHPWNWNNKIKSLIVGRYVLVEMCTEPDYGGECAQFGKKKLSNLNDFNNQYSSIRMTPFNDLKAQSGQVTVFMDRGYQSHAKTIDSSAPTLASVHNDFVDTIDWNERIASFIVGPDVLVEMCTEPNYGGECEQFGKLAQYQLYIFEFMFSSLKVTLFDELRNAAGQVTVFTGTNYEDYAMTIDSSAPRLAGVRNDFVHPWNWNNKIKSLIVGTNVFVQFFEDEEYGGEYLGYGKGQFSSLSTFNGQVSSIKITPIDQVIGVVAFSETNYAGTARAFRYFGIPFEGNYQSIHISSGYIASTILVDGRHEILYAGDHVDKAVKQITVLPLRNEDLCDTLAESLCECGQVVDNFRDPSSTLGSCRNATSIEEITAFQASHVSCVEEALRTDFTEPTVFYATLVSQICFECLEILTLSDTEYVTFQHIATFLKSVFNEYAPSESWIGTTFDQLPSDEDSVYTNYTETTLANDLAGVVGSIGTLERFRTNGFSSYLEHPIGSMSGEGMAAKAFLDINAKAFMACDYVPCTKCGEVRDANNNCVSMESQFGLSVTNSHWHKLELYRGFARCTLLKNSDLATISSIPKVGFLAHAAYCLHTFPDETVFKNDELVAVAEEIQDYSYLLRELEQFEFEEYGGAEVESRVVAVQETIRDFIVRQTQSEASFEKVPPYPVSYYRKKIDRLTDTLEKIEQDYKDKELANEIKEFVAGKVDELQLGQANLAAFVGEMVVASTSLVQAEAEVLIAETELDIAFIEDSFSARASQVENTLRDLVGDTTVATFNPEDGDAWIHKLIRSKDTLGESLTDTIVGLYEIDVQGAEVDKAEAIKRKKDAIMGILGAGLSLLAMKFGGMGGAMAASAVMEGMGRRRLMDNVQSMNPFHEQHFRKLIKLGDLKRLFSDSPNYYFPDEGADIVEKGYIAAAKELGMTDDILLDRHRFSSSVNDDIKNCYQTNPAAYCDAQLEAKAREQMTSATAKRSMCERAQVGAVYNCNQANQKYFNSYSKKSTVVKATLAGIVGLGLSQIPMPEEIPEEASMAIKVGVGLTGVFAGWHFDKENKDQYKLDCGSNSKICTPEFLESTSGDLTNKLVTKFKKDNEISSSRRRLSIMPQLPSAQTSSNTCQNNPYLDTSTSRAKATKPDIINRDKPNVKQQKSTFRKTIQKRARNTVKKVRSFKANNAGSAMAAAAVVQSIMSIDFAALTYDYNKAYEEAMENADATFKSNMAQTDESLEVLSDTLSEVMDAVSGLQMRIVTMLYGETAFEPGYEGDGDTEALRKLPVVWDSLYFELEALLDYKLGICPNPTITNHQTGASARRLSEQEGEPSSLNLRLQNSGNSVAPLRRSLEDKMNADQKLAEEKRIYQEKVNEYNGEYQELFTSCRDFKNVLKQVTTLGKALHEAVLDMLEDARKMQMIQNKKALRENRAAGVEASIEYMANATDSIVEQLLPSDGSDDIDGYKKIATATAEFFANAAAQEQVLDMVQASDGLLNDYCAAWNYARLDAVTLDECTIKLDAKAPIEAASAIASAITSITEKFTEKWYDQFNGGLEPFGHEFEVMDVSSMVNMVHLRNESFTKPFSIDLSAGPCEVDAKSKLLHEVFNSSSLFNGLEDYNYELLTVGFFFTDVDDNPILDVVAQDSVKMKVQLGNTMTKVKNGNTFRYSFDSMSSKTILYKEPINYNCGDFMSMSYKKRTEPNEVAMVCIQRQTWGFGGERGAPQLRVSPYTKYTIKLFDVLDEAIRTKLIEKAYGLKMFVVATPGGSKPNGVDYCTPSSPEQQGLSTFAYAGIGIAAATAAVVVGYSVKVRRNRLPVASVAEPVEESEPDRLASGNPMFDEMCLEKDALRFDTLDIDT